MTILCEETKTPGGRYLMYLKVSGDVAEEEARALLETTKRAHKMFGTLNMLSIVAPNTKYSAESQRIFTREFPPYVDRVATVTTNIIVRAAINFMARVGGQSKIVRMFPSEQTAMQWLDEPR